MVRYHQCMHLILMNEM